MAPYGGPSLIDVVRQLVFVGRFIIRKVRRELFTNSFDAFHETFREMARAELIGHGCDDTGPKLLSDFFMDAGITEHNELSPRRHDEEKHTVAFSRMRDAHAVKRLFCGGLDISPKQARYGNADFT